MRFAAAADRDLGEEHTANAKKKRNSIDRGSVNGICLPQPSSLLWFCCLALPVFPAVHCLIRDLVGRLARLSSKAWSGENECFLFLRCARQAFVFSKGRAPRQGPRGQEICSRVFITLTFSFCQLVVFTRLKLCVLRLAVSGLFCKRHLVDDSRPILLTACSGLIVAALRGADSFPAQDILQCSHKIFKIGLGVILSMMP